MVSVNVDITPLPGKSLSRRENAMIRPEISSSQKLAERMLSRKFDERLCERERELELLELDDDDDDGEEDEDGRGQSAANPSLGVLKLPCLECTVKETVVRQQVDVFCSNHRVIVCGKTHKDGGYLTVKSVEKKDTSTASIFAKLLTSVGVESPFQLYLYNHEFHAEH